MSGHRWLRYPEQSDLDFWPLCWLFLDKSRNVGGGADQGWPSGHRVSGLALGSDDAEIELRRRGTAVLGNQRGGATPLRLCTRLRRLERKPVTPARGSRHSPV